MSARRNPPPALAARALRLERRARLEGGEALIDQLNREREAALELGGEAARRVRERPLAAIGIIRGSHHEQPGRECAHGRADRLPVGTAGADGGRLCGAARLVSVSPQAMPIRFSPKSKARTVCARVMPLRVRVRHGRRRD